MHFSSTRFIANLYRTDWAACESLLSSLSPDTCPDPDMVFMLSEIRIQYLASRGLYSDALSAIEALSTQYREKGADVFQRISMLIAKAELFRKTGKPVRGFSVALRAASVAFKTRIMPCLWTAIGLLSSILNEIGEFEAAAKLLHAAIPQVCTSDSRETFCFDRICARAHPLVDALYA